jgi:hypothetical protein
MCNKTKTTLVTDQLRRASDHHLTQPQAGEQTSRLWSSQLGIPHSTTRSDEKQDLISLKTGQGTWAVQPPAHEVAVPTLETYSTI